MSACILFDLNKCFFRDNILLAICVFSIIVVGFFPFSLFSHCSWLLGTSCACLCPSLLLWLDRDCVLLPHLDAEAQRKDSDQLLVLWGSFARIHKGKKKKKEDLKAVLKSLDCPPPHLSALTSLYWEGWGRSGGGRSCKRSRLLSGRSLHQALTW